jgi:hypothetical protein
VDKYTTEGDLRRYTQLNIKRLKEIGCYRGRRHYNVSCRAAWLDARREMPPAPRRLTLAFVLRRAEPPVPRPAHQEQR